MRATYVSPSVCRPGIRQERKLPTEGIYSSVRVIIGVVAVCVSILLHFKVKMRSGRVSCHSNFSNGISLLNPCPIIGVHCYQTVFLHMHIDRTVPSCVLDNNTMPTITAVKITRVTRS